MTRNDTYQTKDDEHGIYKSISMEIVPNEHTEHLQ